MGIFSKKNNAVGGEQFLIESDDVAALLESQRWSVDGVEGATHGEGKERVRELLKQLSERPLLEDSLHKILLSSNSYII